MNDYLVAVFAYPQEFRVSARTEEQAKEQAKELFSKSNNGASVFKTVTEKVIQ